MQIPDPPDIGRGKNDKPFVPKPPKPEYDRHVPFDDEDADEYDYDTAPPWLQEVPKVAPEIGLTARDRDEFKCTLAEVVRRKSEALRLFQPLPEQERFFASDAAERVALGGNRGGKTSATVVEIARAVTGQDPYNKYPKRDGIFVLVGLDLSHCSKVFFKKLFRPGAFKVIRDLSTGEWRTFNPTDPSDLARIYESKLSPPLIPSRFYDFNKIAWENKKDSIPKTIPLKNGWVMYFFSSKGSPPNGINVDGVCFDEEIEHPLWYPEMAARLLDNRTQDPITGKVQGGKFLWSATPQAATQQLYDLNTRADEQRELDATLLALGKPVPNPTIEVFCFPMLANNFVSDASKAEFIEKFANNPDEYAVRVEGKFALAGMRVYSEFSPKGAHGIDPFVVPEEWSRYVAIDPGHQVCAALFCAMAPPGHPLHGRKIIYDELYILKSSAKIFAEKLRQKIGLIGATAFIIDHRAGRQTSMASGRTNEDHFSAELKLAGVSSEKTGHGFIWGSDDVTAGIESVRRGLHIVDGKTELVVMKEKCAKLKEEMGQYSYRRDPSGYVTDDVVKKRDHLVDCLRYLMMANLKYVKPKTRKARVGYTTEAINRKKARAAARDQSGDSVRVG